MATSTTEREQQIQKLREIIKNIDYGMFTTVDDDESLHSYPMSTSGEINFDGTLWFFTYAKSHKVSEIEHHQQVNVSFSSPDQQRFVSLSGTAEW
jgi:general stress protein 26